MLTDEQRQKGYLALLPTIEDLEKAHALVLHKEAINSMDMYGLPYRICMDQYKKYDTNYRKKYCTLNYCYPLPGYERDKVIPVNACDFIAPNRPNNTLIDNFSVDNIKDDVKGRVIAYMNDIQPWHIFDNKWKYYFIHFLVGYDFNTFREFDFYGTTGEHTKDDIVLLRNMYSRMQCEYLENPGNYMQSEPLITDYDIGNYTDVPFKVIWNDKERKEIECLEEQLNIHNGDY